MNGFQAICDTIREECNSDLLPPFLDVSIELFSKAHIYYRIYKQTRMNQNIARDPSQGNPAVYGAALQLASDYTTIGSYAVNIALVTKCTEDLLQEYRRLSEDYQRLRHTIDWQYPLYHSVDWKRKGNSNRLLSPSLSILWQIQIMGRVEQILKIIRCALDVFWQLFKLSMCLCDVYLLLDGDSQTRYTACTELVADWNDYQNQLKEDHKCLVEELEKGCDLADRILTRLGIEKDSDFIIDQLKQEIGKCAQETEQVLENLYDRADETLDTVYIQGVITPLHINLTEGSATAPILPYDRFPPWAGQAIVINPSAKSPPLSVDSATEFVLNLVDLPVLKNPIKGILQLAEKINQFYQEQNSNKI